VEKKKYLVALPKDYQGPSRVVVGNGYVFDVRRYDDEDQTESKKLNDYPVKEMILSESEAKGLSRGYGFKVKEIITKKEAEKKKSEEGEKKGNE
jgi:hypothetical protein